MDEAKIRLFESQKKLLDTFLENGNISKTQYETSLKGLCEKMGFDYPEKQSDNN